ncbi:aromatic ring-hydroxylating dioxygenase subunit alpha [Sphingomonas sp. BIUV-7]|uniref:Aromatic ring-hydroxylating dioxygenase subunit alpha n=1 Tax=Sphingomonas natans TaxID=3063330 RepID=A0ABT8YCK3_9SPHN|nr:aromatic ring-hydroxylating dioxygenase subunit alpha [Sphingomonas sp. BIUV-7]MDO6415558.1 aromatic ring-hydroxylating dioxygenase subunit alpha [Sphingomonas sp. BIUV-7]
MSSWMVDRWYVAAWDAEVDRAPVARTICRVPILLYRTLDRRVIAMRDACPHRLLPLSMGIREGDSIRCRYHGLKIGPDGVAEEMPLKTERLNTAICVETYAIAEKHRFVWLWVGDKAKADPALIPDFWPCSAEGWTFDGGHDRVGCDYRLLIDNLMDLTHETHVHAGSIGQPELMEAPIETASEGEAVTVSRWMPGVDAPPFWRGALKQDGPVDRWQVCHFVAPSSVIIDVGVAPVGAGATLADHDRQGVRGFVIDSMTPETGTSCHYFWGMARNFDISDQGFTARFKRQQGGVFAEDIEILEAQQRSILANPDLKLRAYAIDGGGVRARRVIERDIQGGPRAPSNESIAA